MKFRRRTYITDKKLQVKFTLIFVLVSFAASIVSVAVFNFLAIKKMEALIWSTHMEVQSTGEIVRPLFLYVNIGNLIFIAALLFITGIWMMKKTSGPLYRMSRDINRIADGDLSVNITLRQKDEFQDTADELNRMTGSIRERFGLIIDKYADISGSIQELKNGTDTTGGPGSGYDSVLRNIGELEAEISRFKV